MKPDKVDFYVDDAGEWRWTRYDTGNHQIVGGATEGYVNRGDCVENAVSQFGRTVDYTLRGEPFDPFNDGTAVVP